MSEKMNTISISAQRTAHSAQRTAHSAQRTAHSAQRTAHSAQRTAHSAQRTAHSAQRTAHSAQRTAHSAQRTAHTPAIAFRNCKGAAMKRGISLLLVVGAFFAIGGGRESAADDNADAIIRDGIVHSANGGNFAEFYKQTQMRLFSALENQLSQQSENALLYNFNAVKKAQVNLQTSLGGRKGQLGINLIGAFAEQQNNAIGWQLRVFGAQDDSKGFNTGVFYRHLVGGNGNETLIGANAFADYENHKHGNFFRYSIGGEVQHKILSFAANYYVPITDDRQINSTLVAFSRQGYDAKLRLNIPQARYLQAAVDYYHFDEKHNAKVDEGFRYGAEAHLVPGLRLALYYDDGGEELGGELSYTHTIGEVRQAQTSGGQFQPDLFAPVWREHSQRIVLTTKTRTSGGLPIDFLRIGGEVRGAFSIGINGVVGTITTPQTTLGDLPSGFSAQSNTILLYRPSALGVISATITLTSANAPTISLALLLTTRNAPAFDRFNNDTFTVGVEGTVGTVILANGAIVGGDTAFLFNAGAPGNIATAIIITSALQTSTTTINIAAENPPPFLRFNHNIFTVGIEGTVGTVALPGGAIDGGDKAFLFSASAPGNVATAIIITSASQSLTTTINITAATPAPIGGGALAINRDGALHLVNSPSAIVATLAPITGGYAPSGYSVTIQSQVPADFRLTITNAMTVVAFGKNSAATLAATIIIDDGNEHTMPISVFITATAVSSININYGIIAQRVPVRSNTILATSQSISGGLGDYTHSLSQSPDGVFSFVNGVLRISTAGSGRFTATVISDDEVAITPPRTLELIATGVPDVAGQFAGYANLFNINFNGTVGTITASGGSGTGYSYAFDGSRNGYTLGTGGQVRFMTNVVSNGIMATLIASDDDSVSRDGTVVLNVDATSNCDIRRGCTYLGIRPSSVPNVNLVTRAARAGADVNSWNNAGTHETIFASYITFATFQSGLDLFQVLIDHGAQVNFQISGGGTMIGWTILDISNERAISDAVNFFNHTDRGGRCARECRIGQRDLGGQVCTRDTGTGGVANGQNCRP